MARQSSIGSSSIKCRCFMDVEVRKGFSSMKCRYFMDVEVRSLEVWMGAIKLALFIAIEFRIGF